MMKLFCSLMMLFFYSCTSTKLVGTWQLIDMITIDSSREAQLDAGKLSIPQPSGVFDGLLIYTADKHFSANIYKKKQPQFPNGSIVKLLQANLISCDTLKEKLKSGLSYYGTYRFVKDSNVIYNLVTHSNYNFENNPTQKRKFVFVGGGRMLALTAQVQLQDGLYKYDIAYWKKIKKW